MSLDLSAKPVQLVLRYGDGRRRLEVLSDLDDLLDTMHPLDRVSPIFPANDRAKTILKSRYRYVLFAGPIWPGLVSPPDDVAVFVSHGLHNVVAFSNRVRSLEPIRDIAGTHRCRWEQWTLKITSGAVESIRLGPTNSLHCHAYSPVAFAPSVAKNLQDSALAEFQALISSAATSAELLLPEFRQLYVEFDEHLKASLVNGAPEGGKNRAYQHAAVVVANGSLSRHVSQMYFGASPVLAQRCHYTIHSLLGVGTASIAVHALREFVASAVARSRLWVNLANLMALPPEPRALNDLERDATLWTSDLLSTEYLRGRRGVEYEEETGSPDEKQVPLITCFSGRDGFRATDVSVAVPLELLTCCNSQQWTAITVTHELSHVLVSGLLAAVWPDIGNEKDIQRVASVCFKDSKPNCLGDQIRAYTLDAFLLFIEPSDMTVKSATHFDVGLLRDLMIAHRREFEEVMAHILDYQYFYDNDEEHYVMSVWSTWEVIPNLWDRLEEYLVRCAAALFSSRLHHADGALSAVDELQRLLVKRHEGNPDAVYISRALQVIQVSRSQIVRRVSACRRLVRTCRHLLLSTQLKRSLAEGRPRSGGRGRRKYAIRSQVFDHRRISSPIEFVKDYGTDVTPDSRKALWILQQVAFHSGNK